MKLFLSLFLFSNSIAFSFLKNSEKYIKFELIKKEENKDIKIAKKNFLFYLFRIFLCILFCFIIWVIKKYKDRQKKKKAFKAFMKHAIPVSSCIYDLFEERRDRYGSFKIHEILRDLNGLRTYVELKCDYSCFGKEYRDEYCSCLLEYLIENSCPSKNPKYMDEFRCIFVCLKEFKRLANELGLLKDCKCGNIDGCLSEYLAKPEYLQEQERESYVASYESRQEYYKNFFSQRSANYTNPHTDLDKLYKEITSKENIEFMKKFKIDGKSIYEHFTEIHNSKSNENHKRINRLFLAIHPDKNISEEVKQDSSRVAPLVNSYRDCYKYILHNNINA